jgi:translation initiation factor 2 beta subunit (eIF-2beta)/eIF-5
MSFEWVSYFECRSCGELDRADVVEYNALGYAVCPACGAENGPLAGRQSVDDPVTRLG